MKIITILTAAVAMGLSAPVAAQTLSPQQSVVEQDRLMRANAVRLGNMRLDPAQAQAPYRGSINLDARKDPWRAVTSAQMVASVRAQNDPYLLKTGYSLRAMVDYDGDGVIDVAQAVNNSRQGAVMITFGGPKPRPPVIAFKMDSKFEAGEEIIAAGRNRVAVYIPDARSHLLFLDRTGPKVITFGE